MNRARRRIESETEHWRVRIRSHVAMYGVGQANNVIEFAVMTCMSRYSFMNRGRQWSIFMLSTGTADADIEYCCTVSLEWNHAAVALDFRAPDDRLQWGSVYTCTVVTPAGNLGVHGVWKLITRRIETLTGSELMHPRDATRCWRMGKLPPIAQELKLSFSVLFEQFEAREHNNSI
jgi:hypothetical protein